MELPCDLPFCQALPKAELHAHLHGCVRDATLVALLGEELDESQRAVTVGPSRTLSECFTVFRLIHRAVSTTEALRRVVSEAVEDFLADGVLYVELRTTPRQLPGMSTRQYVECVLETASGAVPKDSGMVVRFLLSVNRAGSVAEAEATVRLASEFCGRGVVGVDFSGDPTRSSFATFAPVFEEARRLGLRTTVHVAEVDDPGDTRAVLAFRPDRLGHAVLLDEESRRILEAAPIPVEVCPTSNMCTVPGLALDGHPHREDPDRGPAVPVAICTDDPGVFRTSLSREYLMWAEAHSWTRESCRRASLAALDCAFETDDVVRQRLRDRFAQQAERAMRLGSARVMGFSE